MKTFEVIEVITVYRTVSYKVEARVAGEAIRIVKESIEDGTIAPDEIIREDIAGRAYHANALAE